MQQIIPRAYGIYGKYLTRFRGIPFNVDCLTCVQRRLLLVLYEVSRKNFVKSAKIVGQLIGSYHPHGDQSAYKTLINLGQQGFIDKQGNWGSEALIDTKAAAYRYTECKLSKWVKDLAFDYLDYVPWEDYEFEKEPLFLPSPLPLGLIGNQIHTGIAFHRALMPKYTISDLAKRLTDLLNNETHKSIIEPNIKGCHVQSKNKQHENINQFEEILVHGKGRIKVIPNGELFKNRVRIYGRAPNTTFSDLINACKQPERGKQKELPAHLVDFSKKGINIEVIPDKRNIDITKLAVLIWEKYLNKEYNINIVVSNHEGTPIECGVDTILIENYNAWKSAVYDYNIDVAHKLFEKKKHMCIIYIIREIIKKYDVKDLQSIKKYFQQDFANNVIQLEEFDKSNNTWKTIDVELTNDDIESVYGRKTIKSLVEINIDLQQIDIDIQNQKKTIQNTDVDCFNHVKSLI